MRTRKQPTTAAESYASDYAAAMASLDALRDKLEAHRARAIRDAGNWALAGDMTHYANELASLVNGN